MYINGFNRDSVMAQIKAHNLGRPAYDENEEQCMYRAHDGNQCLVGCFIPDDLYEDDFEGEGSHTIYDKMPDKMPVVRPILHKLQNFHDNYMGNYASFFKDVEFKLIELEKQWEEK